MKGLRWARAAVKAARWRTGAANLIVTRRCDLRCSYCHAVRKTPEIGVGDWLRIVGQLSPRYAVFTLSGGEPLLYRELPQLVEGIAAQALVGLCSNLRQLTPTHLDTLARLDYLNFSIDQPDARAGDASPKDAFGKIGWLADAARRRRIVLAGTAVITRRTLAGIPDVVRTLNRHGVPANLQIVQAPGPGDAFAGPQDRRELDRVIAELRGMKRAGALIDETDDYLAGIPGFVGGHRAVHCQAGRAYLAVDADGRPMPCQARPAVGPSLLAAADPVAVLRQLPASVPADCRCWWNCYHWYGDWANNPWRYLLRHAGRRLLPPGRRIAA